MKKAWFSREHITRTNIQVSYMHVLHIRPNRPIYPRDWMMIIVRWKVLSWKDKPQGELKIHQLRDNIRRHQLTLSLCRSYRDPIPSLFSKEVKSKQSSNGCVILRYGTWFRSSNSRSPFASLNCRQKRPSVKIWSVKNCTYTTEKRATCFCCLFFINNATCFH
jgi:hypothetical protein